MSSVNREGAVKMNAKRKRSEGRRTEGEPELARRKAKRNRLVIISAVIAAIAGISIYFAPLWHTEENGMPVEAVWIEPHVVGDIVSISVSEVENSRNVHFEVETQTGDMHFMAYILNGEIRVRASVCPPCQGIGYSLDKDILVCDTCATTFRAKTGDGIKGACVNYPKAGVPYETIDGSIVTKKADLLVAYENTLEPGWP